ncbi:hypothetical protein V498_01246 [Pseudogymnoascus sp. VKM F-4517 (FW-2822)]|nr:hypothetical protein V498_01246 [Pseudogymnoascus sp. VKM F-4517 (FW-2822)]
MQIETSGWNAERSEGGAVVAMMRRKVPKGRKSSREIEEAIARVEARFAAINVETSRRAAIEGALSSPGQAYVASPGRSDNDPELHTQKSLLDDTSGPRMEIERQVNDYPSPRNRYGPGQLSSIEACSPHFGSQVHTSGPRMEIERQVNDYPNPRNRYGPGQLSSIEACSPHFGSQVPTGNAYTGYQFSNEAVGHGALLEKKNPNNAKDENDAGRQLDAARLPGERKIRVQNYIGTTKYYPGKEQYRGASWDEVIANVKYKPDSVVPRGPRDKHERNAQSRGTAQQFTPQMLCSNFSGPAPGMGALPVAGIRGSQSTAPEEISAAAQRPDPHVPQAGPLSVHHPELESVLEYSPRNRPYRGPAIVSSDMAISDMAIRGYT